MRLLAAFGVFWLLLCAVPAAAAADDAGCSLAGIGAVRLTADAPVAIMSVSTEALPRGGRYCLVAIRVGSNLNLLAGLPLDGHWNGDIQAIGRGGYGGRLDPPVAAVARGYLGVSSDTGHSLAAREPGVVPEGDWRETSGAFALFTPGVPDLARRIDFAWRASHVMAVVAKQLAAAYYGRPAMHSFWFGCSTQGSHGLRAIQEHPEDYDGVLAGDPAIHFGEVMAFQLWPQVVMKDRVGKPVLPAKLDLATRSAVRACDPQDGVIDGILADPRACRYRAVRDRAIVSAACAGDDGSCLSPSEAEAIDAIWRGPRDAKGRLLWRGIERGAPLGLLAGPEPFPYALAQPRYWVYLDPAWDWRSVTMENFPASFAKSVAAVDPLMAADDPDLSRFFARGGKILLYHGFNDAGILPHGTIAWYEAVRRAMHRRYRALDADLRLFMLPGVGHCGGGDAPQLPSDMLVDALREWVERGVAPEGLTAVQHRPGMGDRSRPVCAYPAVPHYRGHGDPDRADSFSCKR